MLAYSDSTNTHYPSWEALVEAEANGYAAVALISKGTKTWPWLLGPFPTQDEANRVRNRERDRIKRNPEFADHAVRWSVRPLWKTEEEQKRGAVYWLHRRLFETYGNVDGYGHLTATDEQKAEVEFLMGEIERKGYDPVGHLMTNERIKGFGWLDYFPKKDAPTGATIERGVI